MADAANESNGDEPATAAAGPAAENGAGNGTAAPTLQAQADALPEAIAAVARGLIADVLDPMKRHFVGKDEVIDLLGLCLTAGENLFLYGPPGTAKTALVRTLAQGLHGRSFDYLLTRFTEPAELFGPFDIRRLREGELVTNTEGMLPEADLIFLDELLNANSAILNSLLLVLNERIFRRGSERRRLPAVLIVGAGNHLPQDEALQALFDRFLVRVRSENVPAPQLPDLLSAGWRLFGPDIFTAATLDPADVRTLQQAVVDIRLDDIRPFYADCILRLRQAGFSVSDRRAVRVQRLVAASALLSGRSRAIPDDVWVLRHLWDQEDQIEPLAALVQELLGEGPRAPDAHPRAAASDLPDPEALARELDRLAARTEETLTAGDRVRLLDRLGLLSRRLAWVPHEAKRKALEALVDRCWQRLSASPAPPVRS